MRPICQVVLFALLSTFMTTGVVSASSQGVALASVARSAGLQYEWLAATRAVQLSGPGIVLVIRPGDNLYEVNDRVEVTATAPEYASNDIYVTPALAKHIAQLARRAQQLAGEQTVAAIRANEVQQEASVVQIHGTILLTVVPLKGAEALLVSGQAPPSVPVMITLLATLSSDIPNVLLSRHELTAGPDGKFQAIIPIASDFWRSTFVHVLATSVPGVVSASSQVLVEAPNAGMKVPAEAIPGGIW